MSENATRLVGAVAALALLIGAAVVWSVGRPASELHADALARAAATPSGGLSGTPTPTATPTSSPSPATPSPTSGPGIDAPGSLISVRVESATTVDVSESVRWAAPVSVIVLAPPDVSGGAADLGGAAPVLTRVQVSSGGAVVPILDPRVAAPVRIDLPAPSDTVEVRYLLEGAIVRTLPSRAGRALAGLGPAVRSRGTAPVQYSMSGEEIIGVSCPELGARAYACATGSPGGFVTARSLPRSRSLLLLQLNLPRP